MKMFPSRWLVFPCLCVSLPLPLLLPAALILLAAPGYADYYRRQPALDVIHYEIALELADESDAISGTTRVHVRMRQDGITEMWLDLEEMKVNSLKVGDRDRSFTQHDGRVSFELDRRYVRDETAVVEIKYHGTPGAAGLLIGKNRHGRRVYFAENWPDKAHFWFPSVDHPSDKATVDFSVTAPERYDVVANGRLVETRLLDAGRKLTRWSESVPIPTYCMVIGVAEFSITHDGSASTVPLTVYAYPQDAAPARRILAQSSSILGFFTTRIGPFPYEKLAQVESTTRIGGMENASAIFYQEREFQRTEGSERLVSHEIAHQWFGNSVTQGDWDHLWLSEGFATYFSNLFQEHVQGPDAMKSTMEQAAEAIKRYHATRPVPLIDPELTEPAKKLNALNYQKGAWILHMLRGILGDDTFFKGIRRYYSLYAQGNASTEDFQRAMESESGVSLAGFFRQWCHQPGWPVYEISWRWDAGAGEVDMTFHQTQTTGLFDMPVHVVFRDGDWRETRKIRISSQDQKVRLKLTRRPSSLEIDPDGWLLKSVTLLERP
jgi:aminopeptidase N